MQIYKVENPFPFMENISIQGKTNFFERRVGSKSHFRYLCWSPA